MQITSAKNLRIMGEHQVGEDHWSRFRKEFPISTNHDSHRISARFNNGILYIKHPKIIIPADPQAAGEEESKPKPTTETQKPPEPKPEPQQPERGEQKKDVKESPKPLEPRSKPEQQQSDKTDQKETRESPKPLERKAEPQPRKADNKKETNQIPAGTGAEKQPTEKTSIIADYAPKMLPEKEQKPGETWRETAQSSVPAEGNEISRKTIQRKKKAEKEQVTDSNKKPSESVHGGDRKTRKEMTFCWSGSRVRRSDSYQKNIRDILVKLKKYGNLVNLVAAGLLILVLVLYIKNTIIPRGTTQSGILEGQED